MDFSQKINQDLDNLANDLGIGEDENLEFLNKVSQVLEPKRSFYISTNQQLDKNKNQKHKEDYHGEISIFLNANNNSHNISNNDILGLKNVSDIDFLKSPHGTNLSLEKQNIINLFHDSSKLNNYKMKICQSKIKIKI